MCNENFTGPKPSPLLVRPLALLGYEDLKCLDAAQTKEVTNIMRLHDVLEQMQKDVSEYNTLHCTHR